MAQKSETKSYAELSSELDDVIAKLQDPDVAVGDATNYYEQAMMLIRQLEKHLDQAENHIKKINAKFAKDA